MKRFIPLGALVAAVVVLHHARADEGLQSGPQVGKGIGGPFNPLNLTGDNAGEKVCQV
jgi:hypothetical protein